MSLAALTALPRTVLHLADEASIELRAAYRLQRAGLLPGPFEVPTVAEAAVGGGGAALTEVLSARFGEHVAIVDEGVPMSYRDLSLKTRRCMNVFADIAESSGRDKPTIGVMCRNSGLVVVAILAALSSGVRLVFLNTDMGRRQLETVCEREQLDVILHDAEFAERLAEAVDCRRVLVRGAPQPTPGAKKKADDADDDPETLDGLLAAAATTAPPRSAIKPEMVILTSGSSGVPRGAARRDSQKTVLSTMAGMLEKIPLRRADVIYLAPPAFHGWGLITTLIGLMAGATLVFDGRFDAQRAVRTMREQECTVFVAVPTMLSRVMALPDEELAPLAGQLRIIGSGGARLEPSLVGRVQETFGHVLHNFYGATELSYITIATPDDLRNDPTCAGSPPLGVTVAIIGDGKRLGPGQPGEIYVRTRGQMSSYTDGSAKETLHGLTRTGDTGYLDDAGRLYVQGRADGMIVSGGENVYPEEVELALQRHPEIADAAVFTVADEDFGQRLSAVIAPAADAKITEQQVKDYIGAELSRSRVPREVIVVDEVVRTSTGKVTRQWIDEVIADHGRS